MRHIQRLLTAFVWHGRRGADAGKLSRCPLVWDEDDEIIKKYRSDFMTHPKYVIFRIKRLFRAMEQIMGSSVAYVDLEGCGPTG